MSKLLSTRRKQKFLNKLYNEILLPEKHTCYSDSRFARITESELKDIKLNYNLDYLWKNFQHKLGIIPNSGWYEEDAWYENDGNEEDECVKILYHVTPSTNDKFIQKNGLIRNETRLSSESSDSIYLTNDYDELILSGVLPEIYDFKELSIYEVNVAGLDLIEDPEFDDEDWCYMYEGDILPIDVRKIETYTYVSNSGPSYKYNITEA